MSLVSRRLTAWAVTVPLAVLGTQAAHLLAYRLVTPDADARAHALAVTGHSYLEYLPLALAVATVLVAIALVSELGLIVSASDARRTQPRLAGFAALAPAIFACQEHFERLAHDGTFPWGAAAEPSFFVGLLLQVPFALVAYGIARLLLGAARALGGLVAARRPRWAVRLAVPRLRLPALTIRIPALARGYGERGPPAFT